MSLYSKSFRLYISAQRQRGPKMKIQLCSSLFQRCWSPQYNSRSDIYNYGNNVKPWQSWSTVTSLFCILTCLSELKLSITALWKCVCLYHCQWLRATITWSPFLSSLQIFGTVWGKCTFCGFVSVLPPRIMAAKTYLCLFNTSVNIQYNYHTYSWLLWQSKVLVVMEQIH